jgi:uncharacterized membrane protein YcaP (DUF421 family)
MEPTEIKLTDIERILIGEVPGFFYLELVLRAAVLYTLLIASLRLTGKRMPTRLSRNEMAAVISLAAAIGIPLTNPERGIVPAFIIAIVLISYQTIISKKSTKSEKFEAIALGELSILISDGLMDLSEMKHSRMSRERLFAQLRSFGLKHLGEVKRFYLEASGSFTLVRNTEIQPGLVILPTWDSEFIDTLKLQENMYACGNCGNTISKTAISTFCTRCKNKNWRAAAG